jgi:hypothetical protein
MAEDLIHCPSCSFRLRLPAELSGQEVECPQCHNRFTAPPSNAMRPPPGREYDAVARPVDDYTAQAPASGGASLTAPAVCLLIMSLLGVFGNGYFAASFLILKGDPAAFDKAMNEAIDKNPNIQPDQREQAREMMNLARDHGAASFGGLAALNLLTVLGAIMMLLRKGYWLAVLGCIVALNPANFGCCFVVQIPFGIWGLIVLLGSGKRAFS